MTSVIDGVIEYDEILNKNPHLTEVHVERGGIIRCREILQQDDTNKFMLTDRAGTRSAHPTLFLVPQGKKNKGQAGLQFQYFIDLDLLSFLPVKSLIR